MFVRNYPLAQVRPAEYNPRTISPVRFMVLQDSLRELGVIKPIILNADNTIIAGHQRTKAMQEVGITHCDAFILRKVAKQDEVRFNQFHNIADENCSHVQLSMGIPDSNGFALITIKDKQKVNANNVKMLHALYCKYGHFSGAIADHTGQIILQKDYAYMCALHRTPCLVYQLDEQQSKRALYYFSEDYGQFSYEHIERKTYHQAFAQKSRQIATKRLRSSLYENFVLPFVTKDMSILDFGAGRKTYISHLRKEGYHAYAIEFYLRKLGKNILDTKQVEVDVDEVCKHLKNKGLFDVVVCDSVLNSIDCTEAEKSVLVTLNALCKQGGTVFFSGRVLNHINNRMKNKRSSDVRNYLYFLDEDNLTANYRNGEWFFQKFHSKKDVVELVRKYFTQENTYKYHKAVTSSWQVQTKKTFELPVTEVEHALKYEFSLPLPNGQKYQLQDNIIEAWQQCTQQ